MYLNSYLQVVPRREYHHHPGTIYLNKQIHHHSCGCFGICILQNKSQNRTQIVNLSSSDAERKRGDHNFTVKNYKVFFVNVPANSPAVAFSWLIIKALSMQGLSGQNICPEMEPCAYDETSHFTAPRTFYSFMLGDYDS